ncbi:MAG: hypothetical protein H7A32_03700 [Deltaproteobacteria bacterium]|nr:hypothetical protein [Deltaproteobacteria bacterium]
MRFFGQYKKITFLFLAFFSISVFNSCIGNERKDRLKFPAIVAIDQAKQRVFVIDNQKNGLNVIDVAKNNEVLTKKNKDGDKEGLLTEEDALILPEFPSNAALASLENDLSRLFVLGANEGPLQKIIVIDFDIAGGLRRSEISPISVAGESSDVLVGIQVDEKRGHVWVTNSGSASLYAYDIKTGEQIENSHIQLSGIPTRLSIDPGLDLMAVANSSSTEISIIDLNNLNQAPQTLDIGRKTRDLALVSNNQGSLLFCSILDENRAEAYRLNLNDLSQSFLIGEVNPSTPADAFDEDTVILNGNINLVTAGNLTDGRVGAYYTQSSGDLLALRVAQDLTSIEVQRVEVGAVSGEGIEPLLDNSGNISDIYFASPGVGTLTVVDPFEAEFSDQIP